MLKEKCKYEESLTRKKIIELQKARQSHEFRKVWSQGSKMLFLLDAN